ncbi:hypothetical protein OEG84_12400 [Hoeflea sp. G2-23]|uniref:Uncharacterized protein n=1 Tax=Hoeflea algicola TaxID=2983763 RepID=A0ABT3Z9Q1_9HYPH|nr:hypothetical protein [Hoeflea algicola]MCY0148493.1 hypothetical protein [Hoeflea algicola]
MSEDLDWLPGHSVITPDYVKHPDDIADLGSRYPEGLAIQARSRLVHPLTLSMPPQ